jgi:C1A family cysteine protease
LLIHPQNEEADWPYTAKSEQCNHALEAYGTVGVAEYDPVVKNSVSQLKAAIDLTVVTVTIEADQTVFQMYQSGVLDSADCGTNLDHAVAAVGYGTEDGKDYYIVRNSWGPSWGDKGYIKIAAIDGGPGICGIQMDSLYATTN